MGVSTPWVALAVILAINGGILAADESHIRRMGYDTSGLGQAWLIPVYLFRRPSVVGGGYGPGTLWCVLFILSMLPGVAPGPPALPKVNDGQQITARAEVTEYSLAADGMAAATLVIQEGPLKDMAFEFSGPADPQFALAKGMTVMISGTVRKGKENIFLNPMTMTPTP